MKDPEAATKLLEEVEFQVADQDVSGKISAENEQLKVKMLDLHCDVLLNRCSSWISIITRNCGRDQFSCCF